MLDRWRLAPWWLQSSGLAVYFAAFTLAADLVSYPSRRHGHWTVLVVVHALEGIVFGAVVGPVTARRNRRDREALGVDRQDHLRAAAVLRGRDVPSDARVRELVVRLGERQLAELDRQEPMWVIFAVLLVLAALGAVLDSRWWLLAVLLLAVVLVSGWRRRRRLRRRLEALIEVH